MRKLFTIMLSIFLLVGCNTTPKDADVDHLVAEDIVFTDAPDLKLYEYTTEEELELIKQSEPYAFEGGEVFYHVEGLQKYTGSIMLLHDTEEYAFIAGNIEIPYQDGTYLAKINNDGSTYAFVFTVGTGEYVESWMDDLCMNIKKRAHTGVDAYVVFDNYHHLTGGELGYYLGSLSYSTTPVKGDYFHDFDLYVAPHRTEDYTVYEFRNGNEVHFSDQVVYITEPITNEKYSILNAESKNMMETLGITREDIEDCIIYKYGFMTENGLSTVEESKATARSVKNETAYEEFLDELFTLNMYEAEPMDAIIGGSGYKLEIVTKDGSRYEIDNGSLELEIDKDGKAYIQDVVGDFYVTHLVSDYFAKLDGLEAKDIILTNGIKVYEYTNEEELEIIKSMTPFQVDDSRYITGEDTLYNFSGKVALLEDPFVQVAPIALEIFVPLKDGIYLADFKLDGRTYAFVFQVGDGVYQEPWISDLCKSSNDPDYTGHKEYVVMNGYKHLTNNEVGYYLGSLRYSTEPVEGDYFNDFDLYVAPRESEDYIVYEFRNGNEVHFDDTVIYITEPIRHERYAILYKDAQNVMETLEIQREDIVDCIIYDSNSGGSEKIGSVINKEDFNEFLDEIYTLEMYDVFPLTVGIGSAGYDIEFVLKDGTTYRMRNDSLVLNIYKNNEIYIEDHTGAFYINTIIQKYGYQER